MSPEEHLNKLIDYQCRSIELRDARIEHLRQEILDLRDELNEIKRSDAYDVYTKTRFRSANIN